jgi:hypothetical protein
MVASAITENPGSLAGLLLWFRFLHRLFHLRLFLQRLVRRVQCALERGFKARFCFLVAVLRITGLFAHSTLPIKQVKFTSCLPQHRPASPSR